MSAIYYTKRTLSSASSTSAASGYPASNALLESLGRPFRNVGTGNEDWRGDFAAAIGVHSVAVHDVNFASCTVQKSADGSVFTTVGTLTTSPDRWGRRRGRITVNDASVKAIKIQIATGTPTDSAAYWRIGAVYAFGTALTLAVDPIYPLQVRTRRPRVSQNLPNAQSAVAVTGLNIDRLQVNFLRKNTESVDTLLQKIGAGTCWFDMALSTYPEQQWPARYIEDPFEENWAVPNLSTFALPLTESV